MHRSFFEAQLREGAAAGGAAVDPRLTAAGACEALRDMQEWRAELPCEYTCRYDRAVAELWQPAAPT